MVMLVHYCLSIKPEVLVWLLGLEPLLNKVLCPPFSFYKDWCPSSPCPAGTKCFSPLESAEENNGLPSCMRMVVPKLVWPKLCGPLQVKVGYPWRRSWSVLQAKSQCGRIWGSDQLLVPLWTSKFRPSLWKTVSWICCSPAGEGGTIRQALSVLLTHGLRGLTVNLGLTVKTLLIFGDRTLTVLKRSSCLTRVDLGSCLRLTFRISH